MGLIVPYGIAAALAEVDHEDQPIDEMALADRLRAAVVDAATLNMDERRGAAAEVNAFLFQRYRGAHRSPWNMYWGPLTSWSATSGTDVYSPDAAEIDAEILTYWIGRSETVRHPMLAARYADLAWEIGRFLKSQTATAGTCASVEVSHTLGQRSIDGYLATVQRRLYRDEYDAWQFLDRAASLAISLSDRNRLQAAKEATFAFYRAYAADGGKCMWWRFDDLTWEHAKALELDASQKQEIVAALEDALKRSADISDPQQFDPHDAMAAADRLSRRRAQSNEPAEALRALKTAALTFEAAAKLANGLTAIAWLEDLIPRYRNLGLVDDAARVEGTIRSRAEEAQAEMTRFEVPIDIPKAELEAWAEKVTGASLEEAVVRISNACLIREAATQHSLKTMHENAPLSALMSSSIMHTSGFTSAKVGSLTDDLDGRSIQHAATRLGWQAPWLYFALNRAKEKHALDPAKLMDILRQCPFFAAQRESLLAAGVSAWFSEDPTKAISILVPQIEAALRDLLVALGAPVMFPDPDSGGFQAVGFGKIISHPVFREQVPKDFRFHLRALYCDPRGLNIRNELAHGLMHPELFNMGLANWVMHTVMLISMLRVQQIRR